MLHNKKFIYFLFFSLMVFILAGCQSKQKRTDKILTEQTSKTIEKEAIQKRFQSGTSSESKTVIDSAIELSKQLEQLSEEASTLRRDKQNLLDQNERLKEQIAKLEPELAQAKKELQEANDLLVEMRIELNNWKVNILGFRDEMRQANKAQLEAMLKIINVLGGEVELDQPRVNDHNSTGKNSQGDPNE